MRVLAEHPRPALLVLAVVLLLGASTVRGQRAQEAARDRSAPAAVSLVLVGSAPGPVTDDGGDARTAVLQVSLRNDGPDPVLASLLRLDGAPEQPGSASLWPPGEVRVLSVGWEVRCAEVGSVRGPGGLLVRGTVRAQPFRAEVPLSGEPALRLAASLSCAGAP